jgi:hypothetical protein
VVWPDESNFAEKNDDYYVILPRMTLICKRVGCFMPFAPVSSRRFLALAGLVVLATPVAGQERAEAPSEGPPRYCRLLAELRPDQREAFFTRFATFTDAWEQGKRPASELPLSTNEHHAIFDAFERTHPEWQRLNRAILDRYRDSWETSEPRGEREFYEHHHRANETMRRECEPKIG